jgi:DNA helicase-2/ATP-dependent DNA helicase PcrA
MLNEQQQIAVTTPNASALILSGAGTGKSSVLVARIQHILQQGTPPESIMAISFTNKAANEIKLRLERQLQDSVSGMWLGTFHSLCFKILVMHIKTKFKVISQSQQTSIIKRLMESKNVELDAKKVISFINAKKDKALRAVESEDMFEQLYLAYEKHCTEHSMMDFGELLLRSYELLRENPKLLLHYQNKFDYVLVDECQDTNKIQFDFLKLLTMPKQNLFIVGDDDQSIYGFRGAVVENMTAFQSDYPNHELVKLEQNYRCSKTILDAANKVIANNKQRMNKVLRTENAMGDKITLFSANDDEKEASYIAGEIAKYQANGQILNEIAVLYRTNSQSDVIAQMLMQAQIPYFVAKGQRFYDRKEIKLVLCYLQLALDCHDNGAFDYCINTPIRGIGLATKQRISNYASAKGFSYWQVLESVVGTNALNGKALQGVIDFMALIKRLHDVIPELSLVEAVQFIIHETGLIGWFERSDDAQDRLDNLDELLQLAKTFNVDDSLDLTIHEQFLAHACLSNEEDKGVGVQLMTFHASKGLEFDTVFLVGLEQGLFPSKNANLEEERRLMYVGITRARKRLIITHAKQRQLYGTTLHQKPSVFLGEIPTQLVDSHKDKPVVSLKLPEGVQMPSVAVH